MKIYIFPNDGSQSQANYFDITDYIVDNEQQQKRCDDAFAITTFNAFIPETLFQEAKFNIQPFTIFEIAPNDEAVGSITNTRYFGVSKCIKYLRPIDNVYYYTHEITLYEPLVLLEAIQIGTKTFTNHIDRDYLDVLTQMIGDNTGYTVTFNGTFSSTEAHSYSYDKGATAFEIANEIFTIYNYKMNAKLSLDLAIPYNFNISISIIDLNTIPTLASLNQDNLTLAEYNQNQDNYCYSLESQVDNVVDRNTTTTWSDLTCRSDENNVTADNCYIELPAKIESVDEVDGLKVYTEIEENYNIYITQAMQDSIEAMHGSVDLTFEDICEGIAAVTSIDFLYDLLDEIREEIPEFNEFDYLYSSSDAGGNCILSGYRLRSGIVTDRVTKWFNISQYIKSKDIYQALDDALKPTYCYYESGSNKIEGIYKYYKDSWIYGMLGITEYPMLYNCLNRTAVATSTILIGNNEYVRIQYDSTNKKTDPLDVKWSVTTHPITNQYVKDLKENPYNANANVKAARSYGNSANFIDYDIMRRNISISNKSLGTPELTLQYLNYCPLTTNMHFSYDGKSWYITSIVTSITRENIIYTINAATDYNKQADSIGVRTQYQATKIALDNIKERHIYFKKTDNNITFYKEFSYYLLAEFSYKEPIANKKVLIPLSIYYNATGGTTLVGSTVDNYSAGKYCSNESSNSRFIQKDASYVDSNGEAWQMINSKIVYYDRNELSIDDSRAIPLVRNNNYNVVTTLPLRNIFKDEHESLAFTIYMPNATYDEYY